MSTKFSQSRATLPRPKVCKSPPPVPAPLPNEICKLDPETLTTMVGDEVEFNVLAWDGGPTTVEPLPIEIEAPFSAIHLEVEPNNENEFTGIFFATGPEEPVVETITVRVTFDSGRTCITTAVITWQEM